MSLNVRVKVVKEPPKDQFQVIFCYIRSNFLCFPVNLIHTYIKSSKIQLVFCKIFNSHENTTGFVFMVIFMIYGENLTS